MTAREIIVDRFGPKFNGKFLSLGVLPKTLQRALVAGWSGVHVGIFSDDLFNYSFYQLEFVNGEVGIDSHFVKLVEGFWVKAVTVQEIINQFPGPYDLLWIDVPEKNRALWYTEQVQAAFRLDGGPFMCVIPEDGHNEAVEVEVRRKGYRFIHREDGYFFMGNP